MTSRLDNDLALILSKYKTHFSDKVFPKPKLSTDILMDVFRVTTDMQEADKQYYNRELGKCWELLIKKIFELTRKDYKPPFRIGDDEPCDFRFGNYSVDAKYRVGSGDSGTLKKFKKYGKLLRDKRTVPVMLFLREDNLPSAMTAIKTGTWKAYLGDDSFRFIKKNTGFDLKAWLEKQAR